MAPKYLVRNVLFILVAGLLLLIFIFGYFVYWPFYTHMSARANMTRAEAEIRSIETALTAILADSGQRDFHSFFDMDEFKRLRESEMERTGDDEFIASVRIYSAIVPVLLEHGSETGDVLDASEDTRHLRNLVPDENLQRLGREYIYPGELREPWGAPYQFYFGPWRTGQGPMPLRIYEDVLLSLQPDALTVTTTPATNVPKRVGFPPSESKPYYIWSLGKNGQSDQAIYDPTGRYPAPASDHYRSDAEPEYWGGGDDINNWDNNRSYESLYP